MAKSFKPQERPGRETATTWIAREMEVTTLTCWAKESPVTMDGKRFRCGMSLSNLHLGQWNALSVI